MNTGLTAIYGLALHGLITMLALLLYVVASHALHQRRHPAAAIAWVLFIVLVPYVALPSFLVFGSRKQLRPSVLPRIPEAAGNPAPWAVQTAAALGQPAPSTYRDLSLHADGSEALAALWRVIDAAEESIAICSFIVGRDAVGDALVARLVAKAKAGVRVRVMVDGWGQLMRRPPDMRLAIRAGVQYAVFVSVWRVLFRARSNLRDHRKMVIVDAYGRRPLLWCGGRNLASEYFDGERGRAAWQDLSFDLGGELVTQAIELFERDWAYANRLDREGLSRSAAQPAVLPPGAAAQVVASGPDQVDDTVYTLLVTSAYQARTRIQLCTPYFVPDSALLMALSLAARRGVVVDVLIPARSNHRMSDIARRRALRTLAATGVRIWLAPQMLHAKLAVIDDTLALAGSANIDSRSLFLNYELMVAFHGAAAVGRFAAWYERERVLATRHQPTSPGLLADVAEGLVLWAGFQL
ncbi:MAG: phospholipase D-like domain-containing protein [Burkholderiaceae bacterium]